MSENEKYRDEKNHGWLRLRLRLGEISRFRIQTRHRVVPDLKRIGLERCIYCHGYQSVWQWAMPRRKIMDDSGFNSGSWKYHDSEFKRGSESFPISRIGASKKVTFQFRFSQLTLHHTSVHIAWCDLDLLLLDLKISFGPLRFRTVSNVLKTWTDAKDVGWVTWF